MYGDRLVKQQLFHSLVRIGPQPCDDPTPFSQEERLKLATKLRNEAKGMSRCLIDCVLHAELTTYDNT